MNAFVFEGARLLASLPTTEMSGRAAITILLIGGGVLAGIFILIGILKMFIYLAKPDEILILEGRQHKVEGGGSVGYRVCYGGRVFRWPVLERIKRMDTSIIPIDVKVRGAYSKGGIPLDIAAIANVKVSKDPTIVRNAIERFMEKGREEIMMVVRENLEGNLRQVVATLTPEEVNEDRLKFAGALKEEAEDDLEKFGLQLDTLKIQHVADGTGYLEDLGRMAIANVLKNAQNAESKNREEAERRVKEVTGMAEAEQERIEGEIASKQNELRSLRANLELKAKTAEENAEAAAREAKAIAEQEMQTVRAELEKLRLKADIEIPAELQKRASELKAKGQAATIAEDGKALATVLERMSAVWASAGEDARDIYLIQHLEQIMQIVVNSVNNIKVGDVAIVDNGDGKALPAYVASFPATVNQVLGELKKSTGVDVAGVLSGNKN